MTNQTPSEKARALCVALGFSGHANTEPLILINAALKAAEEQAVERLRQDITLAKMAFEADDGRRLRGELRSPGRVLDESVQRLVDAAIGYARRQEGAAEERGAAAEPIRREFEEVLRG